MTSQAETVELLIRKANFQPQVALAVVEAIDKTIKDAQFVTVSILDARLAELKAMIEVSNERLLKELATTRGQFSAELATTRGHLSKEIANSKGELARWVLLVMLGSVAISTVASEVTYAIHQGR
jgi:hypothetical protein